MPRDLALPPLRSSPILGELLPRALEADLDEADLHLGLELATLVPPADRPGLAALATALRLAEREGSSRLPLRGPGFARFAEALALPPAVSALALELAEAPERLGPVTGGSEAFRPLLVADGCLYPQRMLALEERLAANLARQARTPAAPEADARAALDDVLAHAPLLGGRPLVLAEQQRAAVLAACTRGLALVTGGPGTGKTSILVSMLRALVRLGVDPSSITLAAPTGKAADRMRAATEGALARITEPTEPDERLAAALPGAQTLHRLLGFSPRDDSFRHDERDPIAASVVVIDESSMVDLGLADRLVRALPPGARLVLVGDADQLPSVEAGAVFRDLCAAEAPGRSVAVTLTHSYRMDSDDPRGRAVLEAARAVNDGDVEALLGSATVAAADLAFAGFERVAGSQLEAFLEVWWERWASPVLIGAGEPLVATRGRLTDEAVQAAGERFERMERARLLAPLRAGRQGVVGLNEALHARACADRGVDARRTLAFGEPLLVTRNDYERNLFNGDQGLVLPVRTERGVRPSAVFRAREGVAFFPLESVRSLTELAWAVTVHKAQGSEHDVVALALPSEPMPLLTRELVYTALTRARHGAVLLGSEPVVRAAVGTRMERFSGLRERFSRALGSGPPGERS